MKNPERAVSSLTAKDVMTETVLTAGTDWPVDQLVEFLVENAISGVPVVGASGELVGVVSLTDIARHDQRAADPRAADRHAYYLQVLESESAFDTSELGDLVIENPTVKVREIMTPVIIDVPDDAPIAEVAAKMIESRVHRLFVTRGERMVGIVTALDMLQVVRAL